MRCERLRRANGTILLLMLLFWIGHGSCHLPTVNHSAAVCDMPKLPIMCHNKLLRYTFNALTGKCVSFYHTGCGNMDPSSYLTFEECRRDCMKTLRY